MVRPSRSHRPRRPMWSTNGNGAAKKRMPNENVWKRSRRGRVKGRAQRWSSPRSCHAAAAMPTSQRRGRSHDTRHQVSDCVAKLRSTVLSAIQAVARNQTHRQVSCISHRFSWVRINSSRSLTPMDGTPPDSAPWPATAGQPDPASAAVPELGRLCASISPVAPPAPICQSTFCVFPTPSRLLPPLSRR